MKDLDYGFFFDVLREGQNFFEDFGFKDAVIIGESTELSLALLMLKCPFLEKKIKGITEFKDFIERINNPQTVDSKFFIFNKEIMQLKENSEQFQMKNSKCL